MQTVDAQCEMQDYAQRKIKMNKNVLSTKGLLVFSESVKIWGLVGLNLSKE